METIHKRAARACRERAQSCAGGNKHVCCADARGCAREMLGEAMRARRHGLGLRQKDLSTLAGVTLRDLRLCETGADEAWGVQISRIFRALDAFKAGRRVRRAHNEGGAPRVRGGVRPRETAQAAALFAEIKHPDLRHCMTALMMAFAASA